MAHNTPHGMNTMQIRNNSMCVPSWQNMSIHHISNGKEVNFLVIGKQFSFMPP
jgi:hypothetical protein